MTSLDRYGKSVGRLDSDSLDRGFSLLLEAPRINIEEAIFSMDFDVDKLGPSSLYARLWVKLLAP